MASINGYKATDINFETTDVAEMYTASIVSDVNNKKLYNFFAFRPLDKTGPTSMSLMPVVDEASHDFREKGNLFFNRVVDSTNFAYLLFALGYAEIYFRESGSPVLLALDPVSNEILVFEDGTVDEGLKESLAIIGIFSTPGDFIITTEAV